MYQFPDYYLNLLVPVLNYCKSKLNHNQNSSEELHLTYAHNSDNWFQWKLILEAEPRD